jgi:hypothetical protein
LATGLLQQGAGEAAIVLRLVSRDPKAPPAARVTAARALLEFAFEATKLEQVVERLQEMQAKLDALTGSDHTASNGKAVRL